MRSLKKNKQKLYYSTYAEEIKIYRRDENGEIVYVDMDDLGQGTLQRRRKKSFEWYKKNESQVEKMPYLDFIDKNMQELQGDRIKIGTMNKSGV